MLKYKIEKDDFTERYKITVLEQNAKKESMLFYITVCKGSSGKNSLPYMWYKDGYTNKVLDTYLTVDAEVEDSEGNYFRAYEPDVKTNEDGKCVIDFDWMFEDSEENRQKLIDECIRRFESAKGKSATEIKLERIYKYAEDNGLTVTTEIPEGWKKECFASDPVGTIRITNGKSLLKRIDGKLRVNSEYKTMLLIL